MAMLIDPRASTALPSKTIRPSVSLAGPFQPAGTAPGSVRKRKLQRCSAQNSEALVMPLAFCGGGRIATAPLPASSQRSEATAALADIARPTTNARLIATPRGRQGADPPCVTVGRPTNFPSICDSRQSTKSLVKTCRTATAKRLRPRTDCIGMDQALRVPRCAEVRADRQDIRGKYVQVERREEGRARLFGRSRHLDHPEMAADRARRRSRHLHRRSRTGRRTRAGAPQGRDDGHKGHPHRGCPRGVRLGLRLSDVPRQRRL